jgi:hypothetical protein
MLSIPGLTEAFTLGLSHLGDEESHLAEDWEPGMADRISVILWGRPQAELKHSDLEDVTHLHTHLRNGRDVFVTMDEQMLDRADRLAAVGISVASPDDALEAARAACRMPSA